MSGRKLDGFTLFFKCLFSKLFMCINIIWGLYPSVCRCIIIITLIVYLISDIATDHRCWKITIFLHIRRFLSLRLIFLVVSCGQWNMRNHVSMVSYFFFFFNVCISIPLHLIIIIVIIIFPLSTRQHGEIIKSNC